MNHSLYISQKFFSLWGKYTVENEAGQTVYTVQGEPSLTRRQKVYDDAGSQVGELHKVLFSWLARFEIDMDGRSVGTIQQKFGFAPNWNWIISAGESRGISGAGTMTSAMHRDRSLHRSARKSGI